MWGSIRSANPPGHTQTTHSFHHPLHYQNIKEFIRLYVTVCSPMPSVSIRTPAPVRVLVGLAEARGSLRLRNWLANTVCMLYAVLIVPVSCTWQPPAPSRSRFCAATLTRFCGCLRWASTSWTSWCRSSYWGCRLWITTWFGCRGRCGRVLGGAMRFSALDYTICSEPTASRK